MPLYVFCTNASTVVYMLQVKIIFRLKFLIDSRLILTLFVSYL